MTIFWWILTAVLMVLGFLGTFLPFLPGTTVILAAAILHHLVSGPGQSVGWWVLSGLIGLTLLSYGFDLLSGTLGAKWYGATRWGAIGGLVGTVVGLFFGLIGIFLGPLVGVLLGEILGGKGLLPAGKSTWGTLLGTSAGILARVGIASLMIAWFWAAILLG